MTKKISISDKAYEFLTEAAKKNNITRTKYIDMKIAEVSKDSVIEHLRALIPHLIRAHGEQHDGEAMSRKTLFKAIYDITQNKYKDFKNQAKLEVIRTVTNLGGLISPKYNEAKFSNTLLGIILIKAVIIIIDVAKYIPASPKFLLSL